MIDTAIACHTPMTELMAMTIRRFRDIRGALKSYQNKVQQAREQES